MRFCEVYLPWSDPRWHCWMLGDVSQPMSRCPAHCQCCLASRGCSSGEIVCT